MASEDDRLVARLGQLALVELDALLAGAAGDGRTALLRAHVEELNATLVEARSRTTALRGELGLGPDPLGLVDAPLGGPAAQGAVARAAARLAGRAAAARALARLDEAAARLLPRLAEAGRQLPGPGTARPRSTVSAGEGRLDEATRCGGAPPIP